MTDADGLVVFLRRQYDEEAALAERAMDVYDGDWTATRGEGVYLHEDGPHLDTGDRDPWVKRVNTGVWLCHDPDDDCEDMRGRWMAQAEHAVAWQPRRALAEIEAKRRRLALHQPDPDGPGSLCLVCLSDRTDWTDVWVPDAWPCETILIDAAPYAGRPGWSAAWRVT